VTWNCYKTRSSILSNFFYAGATNKKYIKPPSFITISLIFFGSIPLYTILRQLAT